MERYEGKFWGTTGTETDRKEVQSGANLEDGIKSRLVQMVHDYLEVFAWSYEDITGWDTDIMVHSLPTKKYFPLLSTRFVV